MKLCGFATVRPVCLIYFGTWRGLASFARSDCHNDARWLGHLDEDATGFEAHVDVAHSFGIRYDDTVR